MRPRSKSVLFVCLGNICRSPALEAAFQKLVRKHNLTEKILVDSCATTDYHIGHRAHPTTRAVAARRGIEIDHIAKLFTSDYFAKFDYILAVTHEVLQDLQGYAKTPEQTNKIHLVTAFSRAYKNQDIPDPYYGDTAGFEHVMDMIEESAQTLFDHISSTL